MLPPRPAFFSDQIIDRYLVACEDAGIDAIIVFNKDDLVTEDERQAIEARLALYRRIGYPACIKVSAKSGLNMEGLRSEFKQHVSVFVGQSGCWKIEPYRRITTRS